MEQKDINNIKELTEIGMTVEQIALDGKLDDDWDKAMPVDQYLEWCEKARRDKADEKYIKEKGWRK